MPTYSRGAILKKAHLGLNLLSFCFNWDNYALLPVLYPRVTSPHFANSTPEVYGWVGASFAIAAVFGSLLFGAWADKRGAREPLFVGQFIMIIGDVMTYLRLNAWWNILGGRIISGFASGSRTCCLWYLAKTTTGAKRGKMIGNWYACGMLGMILAPAMAAISGVFPTPESGSIFSINAYNAPGLSSLLLHFVAVYIVHHFVHNAPAEEQTTALLESGDQNEEDASSTLASPSSSSGPPMGCYILVLCNYFMNTGISSFETVVVPLFGDRFKSPAWVSGLVFAGIGFVVLISAIVSGVLNEGLKWSERKVESIGLFLFVIGCALSYDYPSTSTGLLLFLEISSTILVSAGFTIAFCMQPSLFSKLIINTDHGALLPKMGYYMSWLSMAGSAAKISGPLIVGYGLTASKDVGTSVNILITIIIGCAVLCAILFAVGWSGLIVTEEEEQANADAVPQEEQKYLAPQDNVLRRDGSFDLEKSFRESTRSMSMGEAAFARELGGR
jgi:MFS family permease